MRWFALAVALFGFAGCLQIDSPDGSLACSDVPGRACPEGFYCLATDNRCWRDGHFPSDMADPGVFMFGPGDDLSIPVENDMTEGLDSSLPPDLSSSDGLSPTD